MALFIQIQSDLSISGFKLPLEAISLEYSLKNLLLTPIISTSFGQLPGMGDNIGKFVDTNVYSFGGAVYYWRSCARLIFSGYNTV
jgi:hypothetical protein